MAEHNADADALRAKADRESHEFIVDALAAAHPDDAVLSEEGAPTAERLQHERVWIVDPLDGTREFGEPGREDWAVHVALSVAGRAVVGAVALPARGITITTAQPSLASSSNDRRPRVLVSRTRPPEVALQVADRLDAELIPMGSAGAKTAAVVLGEADVYLHAGGQYEWDSAAPVAVAAAAGLHTSRLDGTPLLYNQPDAWLPDLLICRRHLTEKVFAALTEL